MSEAPTHEARSPFRGRGFWLKAALGLGITAGLFVFLFRFVDWSHVAALTAKARWGILLWVLPIYELLYLARAGRFVLLAPRTPFGVMLCIAAVHNFSLRVLPMRTGELSYALLVKKAGTSGLGESLLGLFLLRILDATAVVVIFAIFLVLNQTVYQGDFSFGLWLTLGAATVGLLGALFFRQLLHLGFIMLSATLHFVRLTRVARVATLLEKLRVTIGSFDRLGLRLMLAQIGLTTAAWMLNFLMIFVTMHGFSVPVSFAQAVLGGTGATVTGFLPVGGIGSFGAMEAGWALGFALVGLEASLAVASGFAFSLMTFASAAALALVHWVILTQLSRAQTSQKP
ncbi:MAG: flippase-like domain-containing protein [Deltaproteobacteria bacterium]|nr:flippase-like domain-containing protein [Deltaproteobacteria bacterium]